MRLTSETDIIPGDERIRSYKQHGVAVVVADSLARMMAGTGLMSDLGVSAFLLLRAKRVKQHY